ncbi:hypothetical protein [Bowdeniella massiliensis]|uniref:arsenate reductase/protein-tyrosine-phosphatase family protein n=1 Tax=Bowdeniella massiliensis TaxID=2932264 RepID=UPI0020279AC1|nr:hypothetical protein [Bowdeniella massiliensis]
MTRGFRMPARFAAEDSAVTSGGRILFVCTGNICRSAFAHHYVARALADRQLHHLEVASLGMGVNQQLVVPEEILELAPGPIQGALTEHRPTLVNEPAVIASDVVLTATTRHADQIVTEVPAVHARTFTLIEFLSSIRHIKDAQNVRDLARQADRWRRRHRQHDAGALNIPDPYGRGMPAYRAMVDELTPLLDELVGKLTDLVGSPSADDDPDGA